MNTLSMYKKPREVGVTTKKVSPVLFSFVWVNSKQQKRNWFKIIDSNQLSPLKEKKSMQWTTSYALVWASLLWAAVQ